MLVHVHLAVIVSNLVSWIFFIIIFKNVNLSGNVFFAFMPRATCVSLKCLTPPLYLIFYLQVNNTDVGNMGHTEVVNLVRAAPRVVDLVVGRVLEAPKPPIEAHLLPDICFKGNQEPLGKKQPSLTRSNVPGWSSSSQTKLFYFYCITRFGTGWWQRQYIQCLVCKRHCAGFSGLWGGKPEIIRSDPLHQRSSHPGPDSEWEHQTVGALPWRPLS